MEQTNKIKHKKKRKARPFLKGRQPRPEALEEIKTLIGPSTRRDLLIEYLHKIQDTYGGLSAAHLRALSGLMNIPQVEVYEVASFYAHFDIIREDEAYPPQVTIRVCNSVTCTMKGAGQLLKDLKDNTDPNEVRVTHAPCLGRCAHAPALHIGKNSVDDASLNKVLADLSKNRTTPKIPAYQNLENYKKEGGYAGLTALRSGELNTETVIKTLTEAGLQGLGGAGFPAGKKWQFVMGYEAPRLMTVNGDEGEPGTFKDRHCLESKPHQFLEGALIAATAVDVTRLYIYIRDEFPACLEILRREIKQLEDNNLIDKDFIELRRGAGAYICGEETALIESLEGKRGMPRLKPPYPTEKGFRDKPTLMHNVETACCVPSIVDRGGQWFKDQGRTEPGSKLYCISGHINQPGVYELPLGVSLEELVKAAGGYEGTPMAFSPGGASSGFLPMSLKDLPLDYGHLAKEGSMLGSSGVVVLNDTVDMAQAVAWQLLFFERESCGQCAPCRIGTRYLNRQVDKYIQLGDPDSLSMADDVGWEMEEGSICGLGMVAAKPLESARQHFPDAFKVRD